MFVLKFDNFHVFYRGPLAKELSQVKFINLNEEKTIPKEADCWRRAQESWLHFCVCKSSQSPFSFKVIIKMRQIKKIFKRKIKRYLKLKDQLDRGFTNIKIENKNTAWKNNIKTFWKCLKIWFEKINNLHLHKCFTGEIYRGRLLTS